MVLGAVVVERERHVDEEGSLGVPNLMDIQGFCAVSFGYGRVRAMNTYSSFFFFFLAA